MPWVRLHAIKAYYDMIMILDDFPKIKQTFNIVPCLIEQLNDYAGGKFRDHFWDLSMKKTEELTRDEKKFILWNFFMANWDTMIKPYPRYWELLQKRGTQVTEDDIDSIVDRFNQEDYRDLQVWFNLAWYGFMSRKHYPEVRNLISKGKHYTEVEKKKTLETQIEIIKKIILSYKKHQKQGHIEIASSPYYHPIMPLLYNTEIAKRCMPWATLPEKSSQPEDVRKQLKQAAGLYQKTFGRPVRGLWPSEGSVCPEIIPLLVEAGFKWLATDQEILHNTKGIKDNEQGLYRPYKVCVKDCCASIVFRDRGFSNAFSFSYNKQPAETAVRDFIRNLHNINASAEDNGRDGLVTIILDGENPWEYYRDSGEPFLRTLYQHLSNEDLIYTTTISDYLDRFPAQNKITDLYSGSWINHNFDIWIGDQEENTAWNYLKRARDFLVGEEKKGKVAGKKLKIAWQSLYAAEGSDWFWWYGDDFNTDFDEEFDLIFRRHLANIYQVVGYDVPDHLKQSILYMKDVKIKEAPIAYISPVIDGINTYYYEWTDAGFYESSRQGGTRHKIEGLLSRIYFGFDKNTLFIRMDPVKHLDKMNNLNLHVEMNIVEPHEHQIAFPLATESHSQTFILKESGDGVNYKEIRKYDSIRINDIVELSVPFRDVKCDPGVRLHFYVQIKKGERALDRYPRRGYLSFKAPDEEFEMEHWFM